MQIEMAPFVASGDARQHECKRRQLSPVTGRESARNGTPFAQMRARRSCVRSDVRGAPQAKRARPHPGSGLRSRYLIAGVVSPLEVHALRDVQLRLRQLLEEKGGGGGGGVRNIPGNIVGTTCPHDLRRPHDPGGGTMTSSPGPSQPASRALCVGRLLAMRSLVTSWKLRPLRADSKPRPHLALRDR